MRTFIQLLALLSFTTFQLVRGQALTWETASSGINKTGNPVLFANGQFVSGWGYDTEGGTIATSLNGLDWTTRKTISTGASGVYSLGYGNGIYVAGGNWGHSYASADGITWTPGSYARPDPINALVYGAGKFVGVGNQGMAMTSTNGLSWTSQSSGTGLNFNALAYNGSMFLAAAGSGGSTAVRLSTDGVNWTAGTATGSQIDWVTYGSGQFVAVTLTGEIETTTDGLTWNLRRGSSGRLNGISIDGTRFVAVGSAGLVLESFDGGSTWLTDNSGTTADLSKIACGNGRFVITEANTTGQLIVSTIPEHSTYAGLMGLTAAGFVGLHRLKGRRSLR